MEWMDKLRGLIILILFSAMSWGQNLQLISGITYYDFDREGWSHFRDSNTKPFDNLSISVEIGMHVSKLNDKDNLFFGGSYYSSKVFSPFRDSVDQEELLYAKNRINGYFGYQHQSGFNAALEIGYIHIPNSSFGRAFWNHESSIGLKLGYRIGNFELFVRSEDLIVITSARNHSFELNRLSFGTRAYLGKYEPDQKSDFRIRGIAGAMLCLSEYYEYNPELSRVLIVPIVGFSLARKNLGIEFIHGRWTSQYAGSSEVFIYAEVSNFNYVNFINYQGQWTFKLGYGFHQEYALDWADYALYQGSDLVWYLNRSVVIGVSRELSRGVYLNGVIENYVKTSGIAETGINIGRIRFGFTIEPQLF